MRLERIKYTVCGKFCLMVFFKKPVFDSVNTGICNGHRNMVFAMRAQQYLSYHSYWISFFSVRMRDSVVLKNYS